MTGSAPTSSPAPDRTAGAVDTPGSVRPSETVHAVHEIRAQRMCRNCKARPASGSGYQLCGPCEDAYLDLLNDRAAARLDCDGEGREL